MNITVNEDTLSTVTLDTKNLKASVMNTTGLGCIIQVKGGETFWKTSVRKQRCMGVILTRYE